MYELDLSLLQKNILANNFVKNVVVKRDMPNTLRVEIEERIPAAMLVQNNGIFYIDEDGVLLPYAVTKETYDIPVISGADSLGNVKTGMVVANADVRSALEIIRVSKIVSSEMYHAISEIRLRKGHDIILYSFENGVPIIFGQGETAKKLVKLDEFRKRFMQNNDVGNLQYIDVRFDDQVIVSQKNS
jgi:cell division protein FtsQ